MKPPLTLLFVFSVILPSCSSLQPETTDNGEAARAECIALQTRCREIDKRIEAIPEVKGAVRNSSEQIAIQLTVVETKGRKSDPTMEQARVLSESEMAEQVKAFKHEGRIVTYPRMITTSGRSVTFKNAVNHPIVKSTTSSAGEIESVPIGTLVGAEPTLLTNGKILLVLDLTRSEITGTERFQGDSYPVVTSQQHAGSYQLAKGETVFIEIPATNGGHHAKLQLFATATAVPKT
ncbi:MAG: hypothetical protein KDN20_18160 [Verrucomicrobiae bacterium]|nr:hypothetical protein [Verrucomicrobiae bacterium]